jgi:hypothetical protein
MIDAAAIEDERRRARKVRLIVDLTERVILSGDVSRFDAERLVVGTRAAVLRLFPGAESTWEVLYARRFDRLLAQLPESSDEADGVRLPFSSRSIH